ELNVPAGTSIRETTVRFLQQAGLVRDEDVPQAQAAVSVLSDDTHPDDILLAAIRAAFPRTPAAHTHVGTLFRRHLKKARDAEPSANGSLKLQSMKFNGYRPIMRLGGGGFGEVFVVDDANALENEPPVKVLKRLYKPVVVKDGSWHPIDDSAKADADVERFKREARALEALKGIPGVPQFSSRGTYTEPATGAQYPYFTMSYHPGQTLDRMLDAKNGKASKQQWVDITTLIAITLTQVHEREWVHRDLKPSNVLLTDTGKVKMFDFGLGRLHGDHEHDVTHTGQIMGTPDYMPPEQCDGHAHHVGPSADLYSLMCMLYEALKGDPPFGRAKAEKLVTIVQRHSSQQPDLSWVETLPPELQKLGPVLARGLQKKPANRGATDQMAQELYEASSFARDHKMTFEEFLAHPELHRIRIPDELAPKADGTLAIPSRFYDVTKQAGEDGTVQMVDLGADHYTEALRASTYPAEVQAAVRGKVWSIFNYPRTIAVTAAAATLVIVGGVATLLSSGKPKDAGTEPTIVDVRPGTELKPPPELKKPPELVQPPRPTEIKRFFAEPDQHGHVKDLRLFAGLPFEINVEDDNAVLCTSEGKVRAGLTHIDGDQLAKLLGYRDKEGIPEKSLQGGCPVVLFSDGEARWAVLVNGVSYIVGKNQAKESDPIGCVYSDRRDTKDTMKQHGFLPRPLGKGNEDADFQAIIRKMPAKLTCTDPDQHGVNGEMRGKTLENINNMIAAFKAQLPPEAPVVVSGKK
ncbi:MAG TPA: serine/threonine-protein kinase, partial [Candidatus Peribacteria bacterium]|nr:serine/threonine-protein kinase [Candidatus Peribacteria bacterium]